jgi:Glyoxalase-like domain
MSDPATAASTTARLQVVFDCADPGAQARFWAEALGYRLPDPPEPHATWEDWARAEGIPEEQWNDFAAAEDPDGSRPRLFFQKVPESKVAKNRVHLDLGVSGGPGTPLDERRRRVDAEVDRLKALGATDERGSMELRGEYWVRMNDPEGNEFCVQ